ncbi:MAG: hypothetical protein QNJ98_09590 [Planctomycetota bacterium]|nr:hypothetical protein [Planctomycetota bacterium]
MRYLIPLFLLAVFAAPFAHAHDAKAKGLKIPVKGAAKPAAKRVANPAARPVKGATKATPKGFALPDMRGRKAQAAKGTRANGLIVYDDLSKGHAPATGNQPSAGNQPMNSTGTPSTQGGRGIKIGKSRLNFGLGKGGLSISVTGPEGNSTSVTIGVSQTEASGSGGNGVPSGNNSDGDDEGGNEEGGNEGGGNDGNSSSNS